MDTLEEATTTINTATSKRSGAARRRLKKQREAAALEARLAQLTLAAETPARLPPELVYRILQLGAALSDAQYTADGSVHDAERQSFLCTASLVCSLWREEAQRLLWDLVLLRSNRGMQSFLLSKGKGWMTLSLSLRPSDDAPFDGGLARDVILATNGLRYLGVGNCYSGPKDARIKLDPLIFASASLSGLRFLLVSPSILDRVCTTITSRRLPFALDTLVLGFVWSSQNPHFPWDLVAALLNSTVRFVHLALYVGETSTASTRTRNAAFKVGAVPDINGLYKPNTVSTLHQECRPLRREPCWVAILAFVKQCKALQELRTDSALPDILSALPNPLHTLAILFPSISQCDAVLEGMQEGWRGLSQLRTLEFARVGDYGLESFPVDLKRSWDALQAECQNRGIEVQWGSESS